jgi:Cu+-exporting ATPase
VDLERPDLEDLRERLAGWLLRFTDTYLRLESEPTYQEWHIHLDPVCGMHLTGPDVACVLERENRKIYFCSGDCRARFEAHPTLYLTGVSRLSPSG